MFQAKTASRSKVNANAPGVRLLCQATAAAAAESAAAMSNMMKTVDSIPFILGSSSASFGEDGHRLARLDRIHQIRARLDFKFSASRYTEQVLPLRTGTPVSDLLWALEFARSKLALIFQILSRPSR